MAQSRRTTGDDQMLQTIQLLEFVGPVPALPDADGEPDARLIRDDRLNLNTTGDAVWTRHVRPAVERHAAAARGRAGRARHSR